MKRGEAGRLLRPGGGGFQHAIVGAAERDAQVVDAVNRRHVMREADAGGRAIRLRVPLHGEQRRADEDLEADEAGDGITRQPEEERLAPPPRRWRR